MFWLEVFKALRKVHDMKRYDKPYYLSKKASAMHSISKQMVPMQPLLDHLASHASCIQVDFNDKEWHTHWRIPNRPGWYFFHTDAPLDVLQRQNLWARTYFKARDRAEAKVKNIDIASYASRYSEELAPFWNISEVYSGMASNLQQRAKSHTFSDPGTGCLALARYEELRAYQWTFGFILLDRFDSLTNVSLSPAQKYMLLRFGEQAWRSANGWPLLCKD
ncbi:UNVERIFIED_ORG: hypothetical protein JN05_03504 [Zoogloea ramigera]|uniref:Uncharacterized protein n=1 Tax=Duganella zoogloeoides TaxID=75659 RepID=A0ABZ0Y133_9BURK|nr:hypothetical protein [Duganella zoogloeoides]WQH05433.1 hypothetical protein SR858_03585 [Duganella zoogloeoides]